MGWRIMIRCIADFKQIRERWTSMTRDSATFPLEQSPEPEQLLETPSGKKTALLAIAVGGLIGGTLDLLQACILFGWDIPLSIAGGLLGPKVDHGGIGAYILGVFLHFFIAFSTAVIYYLASRRLFFLKEHPLVCGLFFGAAVETVMNLIVLPLSALHARGPYELHDLLQGLLVHMVTIGLPIAFSIRRFAN
jgi:hypothetical protein